MNELTEEKKTKLFKQYEPLIYKIVNQMSENSPLSYEDVYGFALQGFVNAMNNYKEGTSQSFKQYAAYQMRYAILNGSSEQGHIVKFSAYQQAKAKEEGKSTFIWQRISHSISDDGEERWNIPEPSIEPQFEYNEGRTMEHICSFVSKKFNPRDTDIFFKSFGLNNIEMISKVQIAKQYNLSSASITLINQKIIKEIKKDPVLLDELQDMLENISK